MNGIPNIEKVMVKLNMILHIYVDIFSVASRLSPIFDITDFERGTKVNNLICIKMKSEISSTNIFSYGFKFHRILNIHTE